MSTLEERRAWDTELTDGEVVERTRGYMTGLEQGRAEPRAYTEAEIEAAAERAREAFYACRKTVDQSDWIRVARAVLGAK